jgi:polar amino acid transport system permease protein
MQEAQNLFDILILIMIRGLPSTLGLTLLALVIGFGIGIVLALIRVYGPRPLGWISQGYETIFRGIPLLVLIMVFGIGLSAWFVWAGPGAGALFVGAIVALALRSAAYQSEIFRGGILSVDPGQMMAAQSVGMNKLQATRHIILPQALRLSLPGWANEYAVVIKDSSLAVVIGVQEIIYHSEAFRWVFPELFFQIIVIVTIIYFLFTYPVTKYVGESMTAKLRELGLGGGRY